MSDLSSFINISANTIAGNTISTPAGNVSGNNVLTSGVVSATGNVRGGNLNTVGNVTGNFFIGDGSQLTGLPASYGNANVEAYLPTSNTIININSNVANTNSNVANLTNSLANTDSNVANIVLNIANTNSNVANTDSNVANTDSNVANISNSVTSLSGNVYANANVAAYLPTYSGNLGAGNVVVTASHGNLVFGDATATGSPGLSSTTSLTVTANRQGTAQVFVFTNEGNLAVPGNIGTGNVTANYFIGNVRTGNVAFTDNTIYSGTAITLPTTNGNLNKFSWNFRDLGVGSDTVSLEWNALTTTFGEFLIGADSNTTPFYFTFDGPNQTLGAIPSSGTTGGGKLTFGAATNSGVGNVNAIELTSSTSNVYVRANNNSWLFDNTGNLTIPSSSGGLIKTAANGAIGIAAINGGSDNPAQLMSWRTTQANPDTIVSTYANSATIMSNVNGATNTWTFDNVGNLTVPNSILAQGPISSPAPVISGFEFIGSLRGNVSATGSVLAGQVSATGNVYGDNLTTKATGSWTLSSGVNTVSITVPANGTYSMWVNGNIPNGICVWNATVTVTNTNVPVIGSQYAWYYAAGNALVLTSIPAQIIGTNGVIGNATGSGTTNNVFDFSITNNSGSSQVVNWGWVTLS